MSVYKCEICGKPIAKSRLNTNKTHGVCVANEIRKLKEETERKLNGKSKI